jgi:hypothetical protein
LIGKLEALIVRTFANDKSGRWRDMPFLMLAKCVEAQAIRKGWPEDLSNTFVGEEIEQAALNLHLAQAAAEGATRERLERIGGSGALIIDWLDAAPPCGRSRSLALPIEKTQHWRRQNREHL